MNIEELAGIQGLAVLGSEQKDMIITLQVPRGFYLHAFQTTSNLLRSHVGYCVPGWSRLFADHFAYIHDRCAVDWQGTEQQFAFHVC